MNSLNKYLFTSERLGFRAWSSEDLSVFAKINADEAVMSFFPSPLSENQTLDFIERMQQQQQDFGHCYFATVLLSNGELIGCIGLGKKDFESYFTPCVDIGWRIAKAHWNKGYATEGAERCLEYAFKELQLKEIFSIAPAINTPSIQVMKKIGMTPLRNFKHPQLLDHSDLEECVCYHLSR